LISRVDKIKIAAADDESFIDMKSLINYTVLLSRDHAVSLKLFAGSAKYK
jgi:hypothetical protein